jgi:RNA recognition motif-containing protein
LKDIFQKYGAVADAIVMVDQVTNRSRCFGFVTFEVGSDGAQNVIAQQPIMIDGRNVEVKLATPKAEQRQERISAGPKNVGLRAGVSSTTSGEYAGLAVAYGRNGWKAGYGSYAFGKAGWNVQGWETMAPFTEKTGFSFSMLKDDNADDQIPPTKKARF